MSASLSLPDHFEVIVIGTGITESVVAAAAARLGHSVLHIDTSSYYGADSASFTLEGLINWADQIDSVTSEDKSVDDVQLNEGEELLNIANFKSIDSVDYAWHDEKLVTEAVSDTGDKKEQRVDELDLENKKDGHDVEGVNTDNIQKDSEHTQEAKKWSKDKVLQESRRFNIDLSPRLLYARGSMVELLISSNISRYTEFKSVSRVLTLIDGKLEHVPSSRSDVFGTKHITVVEKRILMKFLSYCNTEKVEDILLGKEHKTFKEFLAEQNLTENLIHFVLHSIAMVTIDAGIREGLQQTVKFLSSLGRFGNTPFLWSMYGTGELPQAFCRLCAVFGGVYYLGRSVSSIIVKEDRCVGIVTEGKRINCDYLVLADKFTPDNILEDVSQVTTERKLFITESSILAADKEQITLLSLPGEEIIHVIEVGPGTAACPKGLQVIHVTNKKFENLEEETGSSPVDQVIPKNSLIFSLSFNQRSRVGDVKTKKNNIYHTSGPQPELDFDCALQEAEMIYSQIFPGQEFLPRAPDPEEIIIGDDNEKENEGEDATKDKVENDTSENKEENENSAIDTSKDNTIEKNKDNDMDIDREESVIKEKTEDYKI